MSLNDSKNSQSIEDSLLLPWDGPAIILVDLDAFFAAVEQLDHPGWRGKPVIVGGDAEKRGVVSTASYEARVYGVRSAMPASTARRLCPDAIWTPGHFDRYREMSRKVMDILYAASPFVQQVSIDEAFVDISPTPHNNEHPILIASRLQSDIEKLGISASVGLGVSKTVAKIASDMDKPRGLTIVYPGREREFLAPLPIKTLSGIGASSEKELRRHSIETLGDIVAADEAFLKRLFGKNGSVMYVRAQGKDDSPLESDDEVKSVSNEITFAENLTAQEEINTALATVAAKVGRRLRMKSLKGHTLGLKIRYDDRSIRTIQRSLNESTDDDLAFTPLLLEMVQELWSPGMPVRLLGVAMTGFKEKRNTQGSLFDFTEGPDTKHNSKDGVSSDSAHKHAALLEATDKVRNRFGESAVQFGHEIETHRRTTGSGSKNPADYK